jgi:hypothetical protein
MAGCDQKKGLLGKCRKEMLHPGDHDNGKSGMSVVSSSV